MSDEISNDDQNQKMLAELEAKGIYDSQRCVVYVSIDRRVNETFFVEMTNRQFDELNSMCRHDQASFCDKYSFDKMKGVSAHNIDYSNLRVSKVEDDALKSVQTRFKVNRLKAKPKLSLAMLKQAFAKSARHEH